MGSLATRFGRGNVGGADHDGELPLRDEQRPFPADNVLERLVIIHTGSTDWPNHYYVFSTDTLTEYREHNSYPGEPYYRHHTRVEMCSELSPPNVLTVRHDFAPYVNWDTQLPR